MLRINFHEVLSIFFFSDILPLGLDRLGYFFTVSEKGAKHKFAQILAALALISLAVVVYGSHCLKA
jgi:hypothetical protein